MSLLSFENGSFSMSPVFCIIVKNLQSNFAQTVIFYMYMTRQI